MHPIIIIEPPWGVGLMKKTFTFILLFHVALLCSAGRISNEKAVSMARQFMQSRLMANRNQTIGLNESKFRATQILGGSVVAVNSPANGFVLLSGDADAELVLGYADQGSFDFDNAPDNVKAWLQSYADQLKAMENNPAAKQRAKQKAAPKAAIEPLIQTKWDQGEPYNNDCVMTWDAGGSATCVTGCVATAMAQVINYHKWPTGNVAAMDSYKPWGNTSMTALPAATMDWANMLNVYTDDAYNATQAAAVAKLMRYCGQSIQIQYGQKTTSGFSYKIPNALISTFGYSKTARRVTRDNYTIDGWDNILYTELAASRPVLYGAQSTGGGHEFVIDGYDDGYYHVNWGWGGHNDGYFLISVLNPGSNSGIGASSSNDGYSFDQDAIIGIQKENGEDNGILSVKSNPIINDGYYCFTAYNETGEGKEFLRAAIVETADGVNKGYLDCGTRSIQNTWGAYINVSPTAITQNYPDGNYNIYPASCLASESNPQKCVGADIYYISCTISGGSLTNVQFVHSAATSDVTMTGYENAGNGLNCYTQDLQVTFTNASDYDYNKAVDFYLNGTKTSTAGLVIPGNGSTTLDFGFITYTAGSHEFVIKEGSTTIGSGNITIADSGIDTSKWFAILDFSDMETMTDGKNIMSSEICKVKVTYYNPTATSGTKYFRIGLVYDGVYKGGFRSGITLNAGDYISSNYTLSGTGSFGDYQWIVQDEADGHNLSLTDIITCRGGKAEDAAGNKYYVAPGDAVPDNATSADFSYIGDAVSSLSATAGSNPNCVYYIAEGATAPDWMADKNVVVGDVAETLTLTGAGDFKPTKDFTAQQASFTQSFTGTNGTGSGWNTIVLPFEATTVKDGSKNIRWFTGSSDKGKNFWLYQFAGESAGNVVFDHLSATSIPASTPLLLAVPDATWGEAFSLAGKPLTFSATDATIKAGKKAVVKHSNYKMEGTFSTLSSDNIYVLNPAGSMFEKGTPATAEPFTAYFTSLALGSTLPALGISFGGDEITGISTMRSESRSSSATYNIMGQKTDKQTGIVIVGGKKVINK